MRWAIIPPVKISGIGESQVAEEIQDLIESQTNPTIAPYAKTGEVHLRVTASAENEKACRKLIKPVVKELKKRFGENVFATDESKTLEEAVIDLLKEKDLKLSLAESLTGGNCPLLLQSTLLHSQTFMLGLVTVFMGCCYKGKAIAKEFHFTGNRMRIREQTTAHALAMLRDCIIMSR